MDATRAFVGLGANLNDPIGRLKEAGRRLAGTPGIVVRKSSPIYETRPQGKTDQPWFRNQVLELECDSRRLAAVLLDVLLSIETQLGRDRTKEERFGPRSIDLDLLLFGDELRTDPRLTLPHPRMFERAFVLVPLSDIAPDLIFPDGSSVLRRLSALRCDISDGRIHQ